MFILSGKVASGRDERFALGRRQSLFRAAIRTAAVAWAAMQPRWWCPAAILLASGTIEAKTQERASSPWHCGLSNPLFSRGLQRGTRLVHRAHPARPTLAESSQQQRPAYITCYMCACRCGIKLTIGN